nr:folylpolyglutamate synthase/dihydrofolate synthase family protein [Terrimicrobiaceae bacterium]
MTCGESLAWLYSTQQFGIKLGLDNILRLLAGLGHPEARFPIVHVAGTNGKGSVSALADAVLRASGRKCGLYTSPHLVDFRERIRVNGEMISPDAVAEGLTSLRALSSGWEHSPTFFEIATALALGHFAAAGCDCVVLETGMGGRLDATNAVRPAVSVLTPIALDHTEWLGKTLSAVAREKAGIIKAGVPVVSAPQLPEAGEVIRARAAEVGAPLAFVREPFRDGPIALRGEHQRENAALAIAALAAAGLTASPDNIRDGLRSVKWPGRFQLAGDRIVLDGGHNPHGARQLAANWREAFGDEKAVIIFGALADKDFPAMLRELAPIAGTFFFVPVRNERSAAVAALAEAAPGAFRTWDSLEAAL